MISGSNQQLQQQLEYTLLKPDCHCRWISKMQSDTLEERYAIKLCFKLGKKPQKRMEYFRLLFDHVARIEHQFLRGLRDSRKAGSLWGMMRGVGGVRKSIHQNWLSKGLGLGLVCWGFKGVQKEISLGRGQHSSNRVCGMSTRRMPLSTTPSLSQTIWPRWASRHFLSFLIVETLLPVTFAYSLSSEAVVMRQLRRVKRLWRRSLTRSHKRTWMGPSRSCWNGTTSALQLEKITSKGTRVSCVYYHKKCPYEKMSGNLFNDPRMYVCMYVSIYPCQSVQIYLSIYLSIYLHLPSDGDLKT